MAIKHTTLAVAAALLLALALGVQRASAATLLGSVDPSASPDAFACAVYACPAGTSVGFRQLALHRSDVVVSEPGVLVSARVNAKRIAGAEQPRIAVLRPVDEDDIGVTIAGFAPLPVVSSAAEVHEVADLHLPVEAGDSIGFLLPSGQVDLGLRTRRQPDGAVQWFTEPCGPCHMDGGTGRELLVEARIEPDEDEDLLGDESQDSDSAWTTSSPRSWRKTSTTTGSTSSRATRRTSRSRHESGGFDFATSIVRRTATCSYGSTRPDTDGWAESSRPPPAVGTSAFRGRSAGVKVVRSAPHESVFGCACHRPGVGSCGDRVASARASSCTTCRAAASR